MENYMDHYWRFHLEKVQKALEKNNFEVYLVPDPAGAKKMVLETILPALNAKTVSWGGSQTFVASGLYDALKSGPMPAPLDTYDRGITREELMERRRQALLTDLFICGTNAITESGVLVNLDMIGNRVGALIFGPKHVVVLAGRNKIVQDLAAAMARIKAFASPANSMRLDMKNPCVETGMCQDCKSPTRICNVWTVTEKSFPKARIKVVLIDQEAGI